MLAGKWWGKTDKQPVIALHGWQDNCGTWDTLFPFLSPDKSYLAIDAPGHGFSSHFPPGKSYHLLDVLPMIKLTLRHFKWDTVTLLGHSMGAVQSFIYSSVFPNEVENFIAIDLFKPLSINPKKDVILLGEEIKNFMDVLDLDVSKRPSYSYEEMVKRLMSNEVSAGSLTEDSAKVLLRRGIVPAGSGKYHPTVDLRVKAGRLSGWTHEHVLAMASCIQCRTLIVKAAQGFSVENPKYVQETLDVLKKSAASFEFQEVEGTHHVHLNNPDKVAPIINKFMP